MLIITIISVIVAIFGLTLAGKFKMDLYDLQDDFYLSEERYKEQVSKLAEKGLEYFEELEYTKQIIKERDMKIASIVKFFRNGIFYDSKNDNIVLAENLERIGEFE